MRSFKDSKGRVWNIDLDCFSAEEVKLQTGVNLLSLNNQILYEQLDDPITATSVLFVLCKSQAEAQHITRELFMRGFRGDSLEVAQNQLVGAIADFFPNQKGSNLLALLEEVRRVDALQMEAVAKKLTDSQAMKSESGESAAGSQAGSASTPALTA